MPNFFINTEFYFNPIYKGTVHFSNNQFSMIQNFYITGLCKITAILKQYLRNTSLKFAISYLMSDQKANIKSIQGNKR